MLTLTPEIVLLELVWNSMPLPPGATALRLERLL